MPSRLSNLCSSSDMPNVVTTRACVSPLVNNADPCVLGKTPTSHLIGLTSDKPLPSILFLVLSIFVLTISFSKFFNCNNISSSEYVSTSDKRGPGEDSY